MRIGTSPNFAETIWPRMDTSCLSVAQICFLRAEKLFNPEVHLNCTKTHPYLCSSNRRYCEGLGTFGVKRVQGGPERTRERTRGTPTKGEGLHLEVEAKHTSGDT